jgi:hypothetical protein
MAVDLVISTVEVLAGANAFRTFACPTNTFPESSQSKAMTIWLIISFIVPASAHMRERRP